MLQIVAVFGSKVVCTVRFFVNKKEKDSQKDYLPINKTSHFASFSVIFLLFFN